MSDKIKNLLENGHIAGSISDNQTETVTQEQVEATVTKLATTHGVSEATAASAMAALFRKGGANKGTPNSLQVEVKCPTNNTITVVTKYDVIRSLATGTFGEMTAGHSNIRKLAESMSIDIINSSFVMRNKNMGMAALLQGDLAPKINKRLAAEGQPALTAKEAICCASYCQHLGNLNELANSTRLATLLAKDLEQRLKSQRESRNKKKLMLPAHPFQKIKNKKKN